VSSCERSREHATEADQPPALLTFSPLDSRWARIFAR
jgi:hypothetical protein